MKVCPRCKGAKKCQNCNGTGKVNSKVDPLCYPVPGGKLCKRCKGKGVVE